MRRLINGLTGWSVIYIAILILASPVATAPSEKGGASPEKGAPSEAAEPKAPPFSGEIQPPVKVKDILAEGFLITKKKLQLRFAITRSRLI
jgi:hypothetical protein